MGSDVFKYGSFDLDKKTFIKNLQTNLEPYLQHYDLNESERTAFINSLTQIKDKIESGNITGDGFGNFTDSSGFINSQDESHQRVMKYINTIASAQSKKEQLRKPQPQVEEQTAPELELFDESKHGLANYIKGQINPFNSETVTFESWRNTHADQQALNQSLVDMIDRYSQQIGGKYNFDNFMPESQYKSIVNDLKQDLQNNGLTDSTRYKMLQFGLDPNDFVIPEIDNIAQEEQVEPEITSEAPEAPEAPENISKVKDLSMKDYINRIFSLELDQSDKYRLAALAMDIGSIIDPEPFSAAGLGYSSDYLNLKADEYDGTNTSYWDDVANFGLSTLGAVPLLGDLGMVGKIGKNFSKYALTLTKFASAPAAAVALANYPDVKQSFENFANNTWDAEDLQNVMVGLQIILGSANVYKSNKGYKKAKELKDTADQTLTTTLKVNGKNKKVTFVGDDAVQLSSLKNDPDKFIEKIRTTYKGYETAELPKVKTIKGKVKDRTWYGKAKTYNPDTKEVITDEGLAVVGTPTWSRTNSYLKRMGVDHYHGEKKFPKNPEKISNKPADDTPVNKPDDDTPETIKFNDSNDASTPPKSNDSNEVRKSNDNEHNRIEEEVAKNTTSEVSDDDSIDYKQLFQDLKENLSKRGKQIKEFTTTSIDRVRTYKKNYKEISKVKKVIKRNIPDYKSKKLDELHDIIADREYLDEYYHPSYAEKLHDYIDQLYEWKIIKASSGTKLPSWKDNLTRYDYTDNDRVYDTSKLYYVETDNVGNKFLDYTFNPSDGNSEGTYQPGQHHDISLIEENDYYKTFTDKLLDQDGNLTELGKTWAKQRDSMLHNDSADARYFNGDNLRNQWGSRTNIKDYLNHTRNDQKFGPSHTVFGQKITKYYYIDEDGKKVYVKKPDDVNLYNTQTTYSNSGNGLTETEIEIKGLKTDNQPSGGTSISVSGGPDEIKRGDPLPALKSEQSYVPYFNASYNYFNTLLHNKKQFDLQNKLTPLLYNPKEEHKSVYGNLRSISQGIQLAGQLNNQKPITSDGSLQTATQLENTNEGLKYILAGEQADDEMMRKTSAEAWEQKKANHESRWNIAAKNTENQFQVDREKLMAKMSKLRSDWESTTNFINQLTTLHTKDFEERKKRDEFAYKANLSKDIQNNPWNYITGLNPNSNDAQLWRKHLSGETLNDNEYKRIQALSNMIDQAYMSRIYSTDNYSIPLPSMSQYSKPEFTPIVREGGTLTRDMVKTVIDFLKESNKNYNKAINRSVRGLYNHIKLQRRK